MLEEVTSHSDDRVGEGYIVNQVRWQYNGLGLPTVEAQEHQGEVTDMSPKVRYLYEDAVDGQNELIKGPRLRSVIYPDGRALRFEYGSGGHDDHLNRVACLADDSGGQVGTRLAEYQYLGLDAVARVDCQRPGGGNAVLRQDFALGAGDDPYTGLDRFGRVTDVAWKRNSDNADLVRIGHGYDRAGNRLWRQDDKARAANGNLDELYVYDSAHRLASLDRGRLNVSHNGLDATTFVQEWGLDAAGNWRSFQQDDNGLGWDLQQVRYHNAANELTAIYDVTAHLGHDRAGNMTKVPKPGAWNEHDQLVWDAWNRLVEVNDGQTLDLVAFYDYDGLNRRVVKESYVDCDCGCSSSGCCCGSSSGDCGCSGSSSGCCGSSSGDCWCSSSGDCCSGSSGSSSGGCFSWEARHYYYSRAWQVLEERVEQPSISSPPALVPVCQYVWGPRYVDDCVLRDRGAERLYALQDANWNVVALADTIGAVQERFSYTAYGKPEVRDASFNLKPLGSDHAWTVLYTGREWDRETGLYYYRARYYSAELGRFVGRDPSAAEYTRSHSFYVYVDNGPIRATDPSGLKKCCLLLGMPLMVAVGSGCTVPGSYGQAVLAVNNQLPGPISDLIVTDSETTSSNVRLWMGSAKKTFDISLWFRNDGDCSCSCCEYRQYVRGRYLIDGQPRLKQLPDGALSETEFIEDGETTATGKVLRYGHRSDKELQGIVDRYTAPCRESGCKYEAKDAPGWTGPKIMSNAPITLDMHLEFRGVVIDICNGNSEIKSNTWIVDVKHVLK